MTAPNAVPVLIYPPVPFGGIAPHDPFTASAHGMVVVAAIDVVATIDEVDAVVPFTGIIVVVGIDDVVELLDVVDTEELVVDICPD